MTILGLILARGGSKRFPGKNIALLEGKPLIAHSIEAALASGVLDRVVVSTDAEDIAQAAVAAGAEAPFRRPTALSADKTTSEDAMIHALEWLDREEGYRPEFVLLLQPTSPLRTAEDIRACVALGKEKDADAVVSVFTPHKHPCTATPRPDGTVAVMRETVPDDVLKLNGALYLVRSRVLREQRTLYPARTFAYRMPASRSADVDTVEDLELAEAILRAGR